MKTQTPKIVYIDDVAQNLEVFSMAMPDEWEIVTFENPQECLNALKDIDPWVIISDQKMPGVSGLELLEKAGELVPEAVRIIVTGQTDEQTMIQLVRRAKIYDYITKPWNNDELETCLQKAVDYFLAVREKNEAFGELEKKNSQLAESNSRLIQLTQDLETASVREVELRKDIEVWTAAAIVRAVKDKTMNFPMRKDIVGLTYDIINSSAHLGEIVDENTIRAHVRRLFTSGAIKYGALLESNSGDSSYVHFGALGSTDNIFQAAYAVATEFREALAAFNHKHKRSVQCGIALHFMPSTLIRVNEFAERHKGELIIQKDFDSESGDVDFLHRMEKLIHELPGTNIILSEDFLSGSPQLEASAVSLGFYSAKGSARKIKLYLLPSPELSHEILKNFISTHFPFDQGLGVA